MLKELKEKICSLLNYWIFDQDKMAEIILKELKKHINLDELDGSEVTFEFIDYLEPDELLYIESEVLWSRKIVTRKAITSVSEKASNHY